MISVIKKALLSFLVTAAAATLSSAAEDFRYSRTLAVEAPGWVRLLLDGPAQAHAWSAQDWRILDADGKSQPRALLEPLSGWVGANALSVNEDAATGTYLLVFDIGPTPVEHRQLRVELDKAFRAGGCRLEASADGESWSDLAAGDLFRLGGSSGLDRQTLSYEPTMHRYLRLHWPSDAGFPGFQKVSVESTSRFPEGPVELLLAIRDASYPPAAAAHVIEMVSGEIPLRSLRIEVEADGRYAYVLSQLGGGGWTPVVEGSGQGSPEARLTRVDVPAEHAGSLPLCLQLFPEAGKTARLVSARGILPPYWILFEVPRSGTYQLVYGARGAETPAPTLLPEKVTRPVTSIRPGDESASPPIPLPEDVIRPGAASPDPWAVQTYKVQADGVRPGDVVRLELPEELLAEIFENRSSLRLRSGGRDIPFIRWTPPEPAIALDVADVDPVPVSDTAGRDTPEIERTSRFVVELPKARAALRRVELVSASRVTGRTTVVSLERTPRPGVEDSTVDVSVGSWSCAAGRSSDLLPCSLAMDFRSWDWPWERMSLRFQDANQEPLRDLRLLLWRSREALVFVWPPAEEVRLHVVSGERFLTSPALEGIRESLLDRPSVTARLDLEAAAAAEKAAEVVRRWWLTAALVLVAIVLLAVLARAIRPGAGGDK